MNRKRRRKKRKQNNNGTSIVFFVVIIVCLCVGVKVMTLKKQNEELAMKQETLEKQIKQEEERTKELEELEKYIKTKKYVEEIAKEKLGLVYPDEILIEPEKE